ncbi:helix-turn-helix transcriptional regulator [Microbacterium sp. SORGH_AS_0862]|uniref:helix-turn-helix domain-containing protein n=1 Tax=Microbacterium sp. SORGH_AS_0862 TaxID=3041789 RepID=UPI0027902432|nr:helix-turn-helix transcriptional regulator [Microbacterium sp. SORGH_AS_0862]MDQ1206174.1 transcriptional regulator with XRE-family HTH domain [Microbacterium sp. SORGH_AS_0862]
MSTLVIDTERFQQLRNEQGLDTVQSLASALGVDKGTASRVLNGKAAPGPRFISSVLMTFPVKFEDVFTIVSEPGEQSSAATAAKDAA